MRWLSSAAAVSLLCFLDFATAVPEYGFGLTKKLSARQEALLLFKRQDSPFCREGYFQCPPEFGGGCCANGRKCATLDCPAVRPGEEDIRNAFTDTRPPETFTNPPPSAITGSPATPTPDSTEAPSSTDAPETTTEASATSAEETETTETEGPTSTGASTTGPESTGTNTESSTATNAADASETTTVAPVADGSQYTPMGISSGAIVGIVFAGITGAVIVGLVLWRAIIGIRHPRKKGKPRSGPPAPDASQGGAVGAASAGSKGFFMGNRRVFGAFKNPFAAKKTSGPGPAESMIPRSAEDDEVPMSQTAAAMGFGPRSGEGAPPYTQDRSSLEEQDTSYNRGGYAPMGGDLGYRSVEDFDDGTQGLFPRSGGNGGFPDR